MTLKRDLIAAGTFIGVSLFALNTFAESYTVRGTVTSVEPKYATKTVTEPVRKCWTEEVPVYGQGKNNDSSVFGFSPLFHEVVQERRRRVQKDPSQSNDHHPGAGIEMHCSTNFRSFAAHQTAPLA